MPSARSFRLDIAQNRGRAAGATESSDLTGSTGAVAPRYLAASQASSYQVVQPDVTQW